MPDSTHGASPDEKRRVFLLALRNGTAAAHQALDHHPLLAPLISPTLSVHDYTTALAAMYGIHAALETALTDFVPKEIFTPRLPALSADLEALQAEPFPLQVPVPALGENAACAGAMYVLEGSRLGSRMIHKHLARSLAPEIPRAFFSVPVRPTHWHDLWQCISRYSVENNPLLLTTAQAVFSVYQKHFDLCLGQEFMRKP